MPRDDFPRSVRMTVAIRAGFRCSRPDCGVITCGPHSDPERWLNLGEAAHITAAAPGGPRYDGSLTSDQRKDISNAIWLCSTCATLVDADESRHSVAQLHAWKQAAEANARIALEMNRQPLDVSMSPEALQILIAASAHGQIYRLAASQLTYPLIQAGSCGFFSNDDALLGATYAEAFESLLDLGLARHAGGQLFTLTVRGLTLGRAMAQSLRPEVTTRQRVRAAGDRSVRRPTASLIKEAAHDRDRVSATSISPVKMLLSRQVLEQPDTGP